MGYFKIRKKDYTSLILKLSSSEKLIDELNEKINYLEFKESIYNCGLPKEEIENIYNTIKLSSIKLGLRQDELNGVYLAITKMLNKDKITVEDFIRKLCEVLPGGVNILSESLDMNMIELYKNLKEGNISANYAIPKFMEYLKITYNIK